MGRRERGVAGGLLVGVGDAITQGSRDKVEEEKERRRQAFLTARQGDKFKHERGLLASTAVDEDGNVRGVTRGGAVTDLGFKAAPKAGESGRPAGDTRLIKDALAAHTTETITDGKVIDKPGVVKYLTSRAPRPCQSVQNHRSQRHRSGKRGMAAIHGQGRELGVWESRLL